MHDILSIACSCKNSEEKSVQVKVCYHKSKRSISDSWARFRQPHWANIRSGFKSWSVTMKIKGSNPNWSGCQNTHDRKTVLRVRCCLHIVNPPYPASEPQVAIDCLDERMGHPNVYHNCITLTPPPLKDTWYEGLNFSAHVCWKLGKDGMRQ